MSILIGDGQDFVTLSEQSIYSVWYHSGAQLIGQNELVIAKRKAVMCMENCSFYVSKSATFYSALFFLRIGTMIKNI